MPCRSPKLGTSSHEGTSGTGWHAIFGHGRPARARTSAGRSLRWRTSCRRAREPRPSAAVGHVSAPPTQARRALAGSAVARRQLLLPVSDNYFCRRRGSKGSVPEDPGALGFMIGGRSLAVTSFLSPISSVADPPRRWLVGACGNRAAISKDLWARLRVHGSVSVHRLFMTPPLTMARRLCRGVSRVPCDSSARRTRAARNGGRADRSRRRSPSDREKSAPSGRTRDCS
jgi:hypothetical protein